MQFGWDPAGNRTNLTYPDGRQATATYDYLERLEQVQFSFTVQASGFGPGYTQSASWRNYYDDRLGNLFARVTGNGYASYFLHQGPGLVDLTGVQNFPAAGATSVAILYTYGYDGAHGLTSSGRASYNNSTLAHPSASGSVGYGAADSLNRLPGIQAGSTYSYDANGNQTSDGSRTMTYDPEGLGQVVQVDTAAGRAAYDYDALGRRYRKTVNNQSVEYLHDDRGREVAEWVPEVGPTFPGEPGLGGVQTYLLYDSGSVAPIAVVPAGGMTLYHHLDRIGTPTVVSGDGSSPTVAENKYLPYGEGQPSATSFGLAGYRYDPESRLYHVGARDYDSRQGRFIQPDPIGTTGGINLYAYVGNDPLNATDPSGLFCNAMGASVTCTGQTGSTISFPRPAGWPDTIDGSNPNYHSYDVAVNAGSVGRTPLLSAIAQKPTAAAFNNPASIRGSLNDATPFVGGGSPFNISPVISYLTKDTSENVAVVNVTQPRHLLFHGYVARSLQPTSSGLVVNNVGEGSGWLQGPESPVASDINNVWQGQTQGLVNGLSQQGGNKLK